MSDLPNKSLTPATLPQECRPFGIYIHWPYCRSKCPYCDFFSQVPRHLDQEAIINSYLADLDYYHNLTPERLVSSIFFGGGTPSLLKPSLIEAVINHISRLWHVSPKVEISLEANPNTDNGTLFTDLKHTGINRLSLGVQALNDSDLKFLGRTHSLSQALNSIDKVLNTFTNHSMDLIYARPRQTLSDWQAELAQAASFGFKHLSLYQLTIEDGTVFARKGIQALSDDEAAPMYTYTCDYLRQHGYPRYEVSNFAQPAYHSRHNLLYWQGDDYLGIGPSAHGRLSINGRFFALTHHLRQEELTPFERAEELLIMGLRLTEGINKNYFAERCGLNFDDLCNPQKISEFTTLGLLINNPDSIRLTDSGFLVMNKIIEELFL